MLRATVAAMSAAIAHEIKQPLGAIVTDATAGLRWLERSGPNLSYAVVSIVAEHHRPFSEPLPSLAESDHWADRQSSRCARRNACGARTADCRTRQRRVRFRAQHFAGERRAHLIQFGPLLGGKIFLVRKFGRALQRRIGFLHPNALQIGVAPGRFRRGRGGRHAGSGRALGLRPETLTAAPSRGGERCENAGTVISAGKVGGGERKRPLQKRPAQGVRAPRRLESDPSAFAAREPA
jgi:hypothetical protein